MEKKNKKKKLRSLILLLFLTIVMLSTSTYAWFTANKTVTISNIDVHIAASSGIQISHNAADWKTVLSNEDLIGASADGYTAAVNQIPTDLVPVSTGGEIDSTTGYMNMYKGTVESNAAGTGWELTAVKTTEDAASATSGDFIAFDIFLKTEEEVDVYLETGSGLVNKDGVTDKYLEYAGRYAFVNEGYVPVDGTAAQAQALKGATTAIIVEPNFDAHTSTGVINARDNYAITTTVGTGGVAAVPYAGVKAPITTPIALIDTNPTAGHTPSSTYFVNNMTTIKTDMQYSLGNHTGGYTQAFHLPAGITKMRVYMWIEGQDVDCENNASGADLTWKLSLTTLTEAPATT